MFKIVILVTWDKYSQVVLVDHMVVLFLIFLGTFILFSLVAKPFIFPQTVHRFPFSPHPVLAMSCLFNDSRSNRTELVSCSFDLRFPG